MKIWEMNYKCAHFSHEHSSHKLLESVDIENGTKGKAYAWCRASEENQTSEISSSFVAQDAGGVDQSANAVGLNGAADDRRSISSSGAGGLFRLEEFFLRVRSLGTTVGVPK